MMSAAVADADDETHVEDRGEASETGAIVTACDDSIAAGSKVTRRARASMRIASESFAPAAGLEPATRRLTAACSTD